MPTITKIVNLQPKQDKTELRVAAYCRVSTNQVEQEESLANQREHFTKYIKEHAGWKLVKIYFDDGISGTKAKNRPGLQQLLTDCKQRQIDLILTKSISRFSRNTTDCLKLVRQLQAFNVPIIFEKENINTSKMGDELILSVLSSLAQDESFSMAGNIHLAFKQQVKSGVYHYSLAPYGFQKDRQRNLVPNPTERKVIKQIFTWALANLTPAEIATKLNQQKIPSRRGGQWHDSTIRNILSNQAYIGNVVYQQSFSDDQYRRHKNNGTLEKILLEGHHPALISPEVFKQVQAIMQRRKPLSKKLQVQQYPFSHKVFCANCHSKFKRQTRSGKVIWGCQKHIKKAANCPVKSIPEEQIETAFCTMFNKLVFSQKFLLEPLIDDLENSTSPREDTIKQFQASLAASKKKLATLSQLFNQQLVDEDFYEENQKYLNREIKQLQDQLSQLEENPDASNSSLVEVQKLLKACQKTKMITKFDPELFKQFVTKVVIDEQAHITFHLKCGLNLTERS